MFDSQYFQYNSNRKGVVVMQSVVNLFITNKNKTNFFIQLF